jgi:hypothetical protein
MGARWQTIMKQESCNYKSKMANIHEARKPLWEQDGRHASLGDDYPSGGTHN